MNKKASIIPIALFVVIFSIILGSAMSSYSTSTSSGVVNTFLVYSNFPTKSTITVTQGDSFSLSLVAYSHSSPLTDEKLTFNNWINFDHHENGVYVTENLGSYYRYTNNLVIDTGKYHNNLLPGVYDITFYAENQNGERDYSNLILIIKAPSFQDTTKPVVKILFPQNNLIYMNVTNSQFKVTEENLQSCWYTLNSITTQLNSCSNDSINEIPNLNSKIGTNNLTVYAEDKAGNIGEDTVIYEVKKTNFPTKPTVKISFPLNKTYDTNVTSATFNVVGNSDDYICWYTLNSITTQLNSCSNESINEISNLNSKIGTNNLTVYAEDKAGNIGEDTVIYEVKRVDVTKLNLTVLIPVEGKSYLRYILFRAITNTDATVVYSLDGQNNITMNENPLTTFFSENLSLSKGNHQVKFCAINKLNSSDVSCTIKNFEIVIPNNGPNGHSNNKCCHGAVNLTTPDITNFYKNQKAMNDAKKRTASIDLTSTNKHLSMSRSNLSSSSR